MDFSHKRVLLIGATGGIGQAIAENLANRGAKLVLVGRKKVSIEGLKNACDGEHKVLIADINQANDRQTIVDYCQQQSIDIYINAAGVLDFDCYENQSTETVENIISTNLLSPMLLCQQLIPLLKTNNSATIINIGSIFGSIGHPGFTAYCASKFGLRGFTEALQRELADTNIAVFYLAPRATSTTLNSDTVTALNNVLGNQTDTPEQVAEALITQLKTQQKQHFMGWPEKLFVKINGIFPNLVHNSLVKQLPVIKKFANTRH